MGTQDDYYVCNLGTCSRWNESNPATEANLEKILLAGLRGEGLAVAMAFLLC